MNDYTDTDKALEADAQFDFALEYEIATCMSRIRETVTELYEFGFSKYDIVKDVIDTMTETFKQLELDNEPDEHVIDIPF